MTFVWSAKKAAAPVAPAAGAAPPLAVGDGERDAVGEGVLEGDGEDETGERDREGEGEGDCEKE